MFNVLIIDNGFYNIDEYKKALNDSRDIVVTGVLKRTENLEEYLNLNIINLIFVNTDLLLKDDILRIKNISKKYGVPAIFSGVREPLSNKSPSLLDKKVKIIKLYYKKRIEHKHTDKSWLIVIGSSTGGPRALQQIVSKLPNDLNGTILIVQHMPANFTASLAERLNIISALDVNEAKNNERLELGKIYIAPGDYHIKVKEKNNIYSTILSGEEKIKGLRPTVDVLMKSIVEDKNYKRMGIILTGMGNDGAEGIKAMKSIGAYNIIQDEKSCVVFGMPRAAYKTNCIDGIVELDKIAEEILIKVGCKNGYRH